MDSESIKSQSKIILKVFKPQRILWFLGRHAFGILLIIILLEISAGVAIFYEFIYSKGEQKSYANVESLQFNYDAYQNVLKQWKDRDSKFQQFSGEDIKSPF